MIGCGECGECGACYLDAIADRRETTNKTKGRNEMAKFEFVGTTGPGYESEYRCRTCGYSYQESIDASDTENLERSEHDCKEVWRNNIQDRVSLEVAANVLRTICPDMPGGRISKEELQLITKPLAELRMRILEEIE